MLRSFAALLMAAATATPSSNSVWGEMTVTMSSVTAGETPRLLACGSDMTCTVGGNGSSVAAKFMNLAVATTPSEPVALTSARLRVPLRQPPVLPEHVGPVLIDIYYYLEHDGDAWGGLIALANGVSAPMPERRASNDGRSLRIPVPAHTVRAHNGVDLLLAAQVERQSPDGWARLAIRRIDISCYAEICR